MRRNEREQQEGPEPQFLKSQLRRYIRNRPKSVYNADAQIGRSNAVAEDKRIAPAVFKLQVLPFDTRRTCRDFRTVFPEQLERKQRQVQVVLIVTLVNSFHAPGLHHRIGNESVTVTKLGRNAPAYTGHLSQPCGTDLVRIFSQGNAPLAGDPRLRQGNRQYHERHENKCKPLHFRPFLI